MIDGSRGGYLELGNDPEGNITTPYRVNADSPIINANPRVRWLLADETGPDVLMLCGKGLLKLKAILEEWYRMQYPAPHPDLSQVPNPPQESET